MVRNTFLAWIGLLIAVLVLVSIIIPMICRAQGLRSSQPPQVVAGQRQTNSPEPSINTQKIDKLSAYSDFLNERLYGSTESVILAREEFKNNFSTAPIEEMNAAFRLFNKFYETSVSSGDEEFCQNKELQRLLNEISELVKVGLENPLPAFKIRNNKYADKLRNKHAAELKELYSYMNAGMDFTYGEGVWYLKTDISFLLNLLPQTRGNELRDYLTFSKQEDYRIEEDAGLMISWEDYRERLIRWEKFKNAHPTLPETKLEIEPELDNLVRSYIIGMDNTRVYGIETGVLSPELKISYESFMKNNRSSSFYPLIKDIYGILKKHNFKINEELINYLDGHGYSGDTIHLQRILDTHPGDILDADD